MCTYFATGAVKPYADLTDDGDVETEPFLTSCLGIVEFVSFFGTAFIPVKNDVDNNVQKIRKKYETNKSEYSTLKRLVIKEQIEQKQKNSTYIGTATEALLWLKRGLEFFLTLMQLMIDDHRSRTPSDSLVPMCNVAYERTLKRHHNFFSKSLFTLAVRATPWRKDFLKLLAFGKEDLDDRCVDDLAKYVDKMKPVVDCVCKFYLDQNLETPPGTLDFVDDNNAAANASSEI